MSSDFDVRGGVVIRVRFQREGGHLVAGWSLSSFVAPLARTDQWNVRYFEPWVHSSITLEFMLELLSASLRPQELSDLSLI